MQRSTAVRRWQAARPVPVKEGAGGMDDKKNWAAEMLRIRHGQLGRLPKKEDFDPVTLSRIKAYLGPWPRALEAAGLKQPRPAGSKRAGSRKKKRRDPL